MAPVLFLWLMLAIVIGFFGRRHRFGFWGYFFATVLFTPIVGVLMLIAAMPRRPRKAATRAYRA
jgi:hypothetical protein